MMTPNEVERNQAPVTTVAPDFRSSNNFDDISGTGVVDVFDDDSGLASKNSSNERVDATRSGVPPTRSTSHYWPAGFGKSEPCGGNLGVEIGANGNRLSVFDEIYSALIAIRRRRLVASRRTRRLVLKSGEFNVTSVGIPERRRMYLADMFTTLIEMRWTYQILFFTAQFMVTWVLFGIVYYAIAVSRGDIEHAYNRTWSRTFTTSSRP